MAALRKYDLYTALFTIKDEKDFSGIYSELTTAASKEKGQKKVGAIQFKEDNLTKIGAIIWQHDRPAKPDEYIIALISGIPSGFHSGKITSAGLINLKKFHDQYPRIPLHDIGKSIDASEVEEVSKNKKKADTPKNLPGGATTRDLKLGLITFREEKHLQKFFNELKAHTGNKELSYTGFSEIGLYIILWHREKAGKDEYWAFIMTKKPRGIASKAIKVKNIKKKKIPTVHLGLIKEAGKIVGKIEKEYKKIYG